MPEQEVASVTSQTATATAGTAAGTATNGAAPKEKLVTVKINGKEEQVPESRLIERYQKGEAAEQAMAKADAMQKQTNQILAMLQTPEGVAEMLNNPALKVDKAAVVAKLLNSNNPAVSQATKDYLYWNEVGPERAKTDPEFAQKFELAKLKREKAQWDTQQKENQRANEQRAFQERVNAAKWDFGNKIAAAAKAEGLPVDDPELWADWTARIARYGYLYTKKGLPPDAVDCVRRAKAAWEDEYKKFYKYRGLNEDNILQHVPDEVARLINKALLKKLKAGQEPAGKKPTASKGDGKKKSYDEILMERNRARLASPDGFEGSDGVVAGNFVK